MSALYADLPAAPVQQLILFLFNYLRCYVTVDSGNNAMKNTASHLLKPIWPGPEFYEVKNNTSDITTSLLLQPLRPGPELALLTGVYCILVLLGVLIVVGLTIEIAALTLLTILCHGLPLVTILYTVSAGYNEFGFNVSSRFNESLFCPKYFFTL